MSLYSEIMEQPHILSALLSNQSGVVKKIAEEINRNKPAYVFLAARGTSGNAGRYASYLWGSMNKLPVAIATPSLFTCYHKPPLLKDALVVGISQSGQSPDIVSVLEEGRKQGCRTLTITNAPTSPLAAAADWVIDIQAGEEKAVAATKTYTGELMAIAMLAIAMQADSSLHDTLNQTPYWMEQALGLDAAIEKIAERYRYMEHCVVIGRGYNYATAFEWSLKMKELCYVVAEPYSSADFLHGPIAMIESGFPVMGILHKGAVYPDMIKTFRKMREVHNAEILTISDEKEALELAHSPMQLPAGIPEWVSPLVAILPGQLFTYHLTRVKGLNSESPRHIFKVTETH
ncbi:MAG: SIS domain-containing protein [Anaerolineaceae bacterium]|nr:SIS domain-containing protein [Anaerolineaceae bacterium]